MGLFICTACVLVNLVAALIFPATQWLRARVDARRVRETGSGGTQDIAIWSTVITILVIPVQFGVTALALIELRRLSGNP